MTSFPLIAAAAAHRGIQVSTALSTSCDQAQRVFSGAGRAGVVVHRLHPRSARAARPSAELPYWMREKTRNGPTLALSAGTAATTGESQCARRSQPRWVRPPRRTEALARGSHPRQVVRGRGQRRHRAGMISSYAGARIHCHAARMSRPAARSRVRSPGMLWANPYPPGTSAKCARSGTMDPTTIPETMRPVRRNG